jgi:uncharacterized membrane protein YdbT with pleckstrin-like domain
MIMKKDKTLFDDVKSENEKMIWSYRPRLVNYILSYQEYWFGIAFLILFWVAFFIAEMSTPERLVSWTFFLLMLLAIFFTIPAMLAWRFLQHRNIGYGLSDKRVMFRSGILSPNYKTIDLDKIQSMEVNRNMVQNIFNTGTINFHTASQKVDEFGMSNTVPDQWECIQNPYEVFRIVMDLTHGQ